MTRKRIEVGRTRMGGSLFVYVLAFGYQADYRQDGWLPPSVREGKERWFVLPLGRFGCMTLGRTR